MGSEWIFPGGGGGFETRAYMGGKVIGKGRVTALRMGGRAQRAPTGLRWCGARESLPLPARARGGGMFSL